VEFPCILNTTEFLYAEVISGTDLKGVAYFAHLIFHNGHIPQNKATLTTYRPMPGSTELGAAKILPTKNVSEYFNLI